MEARNSSVVLKSAPQITTSVKIRQMTRKNLRIRAYAKINLNLRILGRRRDGMHELRTILQTIDLYDTLTFQQQLGPLHEAFVGTPCAAI